MRRVMGRETCRVCPQGPLHLLQADLPPFCLLDCNCSVRSDKVIGMDALGQTQEDPLVGQCRGWVPKPTLSGGTMTFRGISQLEGYKFFFCDTFFRSCLPFISLFWLPALVSQKCQQFFLLRPFVYTPWSGWQDRGRGVAVTGW